jgi:hypothetical protein
MQVEIIGKSVKLSRKAKLELLANGCEEHVNEFENDTGTVIGFMYEDTFDFVDVRWGKSGLKYGYLLTDLEFIG